MPFQEALGLYMSIGGVPEYLIKASEYKSFKDFIEKEFFSKHGYFYREPYFIISQEFKELKTYFSILNAIAYGNTKPTEIANFTGIGAREIYPYLENLLRLGFIERQVSVIGNPKKGLYLIKDHVFDFWFNFVFKYREEIERGVFSPENELFSSFFGKKFEAFVLKEFIFDLLPSYKKIGKETGKILSELKRKATLVKWQNPERKERYGVIAKIIEGKEAFREKGCFAFDLEDFRYHFSHRLALPF